MMSKRFRASTYHDYYLLRMNNNMRLAICPDCGAYVLDVQKHVKFHENLRLEE